MRKVLITTIITLLLPLTGNAQLWKMRRIEITAGLGTTQFFGDIGGYSQGENTLGLKDILLSHTRFNISSSIRYRILNNVSARLNMSLGSFHSTDETGSNEYRQFESTTTFFEPSIIGEFYFIKNRGEKSFLLMKGSSYPFPKKFFPMLDCYLFTGIGGLSYNVKPNDNLQAYTTKTEGFTGIIPFGLGTSFTYSGTYNFGLEMGARYAFSDNIDGYTSEYSKSNDIYFMLNFSFIYKLKTGSNGLPVFLKGNRRR